MKPAHKARLARLTKAPRRVPLCDCREQLDAIARAEVAVDVETGICRFCGRPLSHDWPGVMAKIRRIYGDEAVSDG